MAIGMWPFDQSHSLCKLWPQCVASPSFALERCTRCNPATHRQLPAGWPNSPPWVTMFDPQHPWTASETRESFPKKWATWNRPVKKGWKSNKLYIHTLIYIIIYYYIYTQCILKPPTSFCMLLPRLNFLSCEQKPRSLTSVIAVLQLRSPADTRYPT